MTSVTMGLSRTGHPTLPDSLNAWLKKKGGYVHGDWLVWSAVNPLGLTFVGKVSNTEIKQRLDQGYVVILNVKGGSHYVLAWWYRGDIIYINDSGSSYAGQVAISECFDGQTGVYAPYSSGYYSLIGKMTSYLRKDDELLTMADRPKINVKTMQQ